MSDKYRIVDFSLDDIPRVAEIISGSLYKPFYYVHSIKNERLNNLATRRLRGLLEKEGNSAVALVDSNDDITALSTLQPLPWDSKLLEVGCARIPFTFLSGDVPEQSIQAALLIGRLIEVARDSGVGMIDVRTSAQDLGFIHPLEDAGFRVMDNGMTALYHKSSPVEFEKKGLEIRHFQEGDLPVLLEILSGAYADDRFHNDPRISEEKAEKLYADWLTNACANPRPGGGVLVALSGDEILGFYHYQPVNDFSEETGITIYEAGLASARRDRRGLGVYYALLSRAKEIFVENGSEYAVNRIPFNIRPILKMTLRLIPSFIANDLTFHLWLD